MNVSRVNLILSKSLTIKGNSPAAELWGSAMRAADFVVSGSHHVIHYPAAE